MIILGINSAYHEPSACIIKDGKIIAAVEEERFTRIKHGKPANLLNPHHLPQKSIEFCLKKASIRPQDIELIGYSFKPEIRLKNNIGIDKEFIENGAGSKNGEENFFNLNNSVPNYLSNFLGFDIQSKFVWIEHHLCHASSAFFVSPFNEAAILSIDGIGEFATTWIGKGLKNKIENLSTIYYPNSLGLLWEKISKFLGFGEYGQYKVMGLAAYGNPEIFYNKFLTFISYDNKGNLLIDNNITHFRGSNFNELEKLLCNHRNPYDIILKEHKDIAATLQKITNEIMLNLAQYAHKLTGLKKLAIAGGVGLNCVANNFVNENSPFEELFIQPAAHDAGTALGACYYLWNQINNKKDRFLLNTVFLGSEFTESDISKTLIKYNINRSEKHQNIQQIAAKLVSKGEILAWFNGRMEFGPRALGNRSILADPQKIGLAKYINEKVKHREFFRPFAASVLSENVSDWFEINNQSFSDRFMLFSRKIRKDKIGKIPAVAYHDNSCRIQIVFREDNPVYYDLINEFYKLTGIPLLLNTSFNDSEPIICSPDEAVKTCIQSRIRWLIMNDYLIDLGDIDSLFLNPSISIKSDN